MGKRKVFTKTDLSVPQVEHIHDMAGNVVILPEIIPPINTKIAFGRNPTLVRNFDFARWYGANIDPITYACQRQIERFLSEGNAVIATIQSLKFSGSFTSASGRNAALMEPLWKSTAAIAHLA